MKETQGNVAYRAQYLAHKITNRWADEETGQSGFSAIEIYIDESYCNVNHVFRSTWYQKGKAIKGRTGVGERANILAAFAYGKLPDGREIAEIVPGSLAIWHGNNTTRGKYKTEDAGSRTTQALKALAVASSGDKQEPLDYHGNVNAALFED